MKDDRIIPIIKNVKANDQGSSYKPISLLSPIAKLMQKLYVNHILSEHFQPDRHQHASRKQHCTVIPPGPKWTQRHGKTGLLYGCTRSKAFDIVNHGKLLNLIVESTIGP